MPSPIIKCYIAKDSFTPYDPYSQKANDVEYVPSRVRLHGVWGEYVQRDVLTTQGTKRLIFKVVSTDYGRCVDWSIGYCMKLETLDNIYYGGMTINQTGPEEESVDPV